MSTTWISPHRCVSSNATSKGSKQTGSERSWTVYAGKHGRQCDKEHHGDIAFEILMFFFGFPMIH